ncbi:precorrin-6A reductase [Cellulosilyticum ruminicola]|uniref:precorrin-6A reductase n=1 Tax=Cellulosilyticum ruminicola TaxID=425254 RepID=UPI0006D08BE5|nr:precorrin-6A reductase [Cellulosilyticum ruminicola]
MSAMKSYLIFAGTTEGRNLTEYLLTQNARLYVCVATEYGKTLLPEHENVTISSTRLDSNEIYELIKTHQFDCVFDATHPYAVIVSKNIQEAAIKANLPYYRIIRPSTALTCTDNMVYVDSMEEAVEFLKTTTGSILATTGSKELHKLCALPDYNNRVFARVLPTAGVIAHCYELGFDAKHIIGMQGPFSEALNEAIIMHTNAAYLLTKDSGDVGGFMEKVISAQKMNINLIIIGRPPEVKGYALEEIMNLKF